MRQCVEQELLKLGFWKGWQEGEFPPYWGVLRLYVFRRDGYRCTVCHKVFRNEKLLDAHHIIEKERGGSDNPKNLATVCSKCHNAIHDGDVSHKEPTQQFCYDEEEPKAQESQSFVSVKSGDLKYRLSREDEWHHSGWTENGIAMFSKGPRKKVKKQRFYISVKPSRGFLFNGHVFQSTVDRFGNRGYWSTSLCGRGKCEKYPTGEPEFYTQPFDKMCRACVGSARNKRLVRIESQWIEVEV
jgi:hypothetical protein